MGSGINREVSTLLIASTGRVIAVSTINGLTSWENGKGVRGGEVDDGGMG